jgi:malate dehydrogenase
MYYKVSVIGAGNVGVTCAAWLAQRNLADIVLVDIPQTGDMPKGKALDLSQAGAIWSFDPRIVGTTGYDETENSDVVVITAGVPRKPGMSREDLVGINQAIVTDVVKQVLPGSPNAVIVVVTNPLDTMCYAVWKTSGLPPERVVGQAGILDTARMRTFITYEMCCAIENVSCLVLGGHGDEMVPLIRYTTVAGVPITDLLPPDRIQAIIERTRKGGGEIVQLLKTGSAYYAPGAATAQMVEAIVKDRCFIAPCSAYVSGEYGLRDMFFGVPVVLGRKGVNRIIEVSLNDEERAMLQKSADLIRGSMSALKAEA